MVAGLLGVPWLGAVAIGVVVYVGAVALAMPKPAQARRSSTRSRSASRGGSSSRAPSARSASSPTPCGRRRAGPLRDRLQGIVDRLDEAIVESWQIARRGDEIDSAVRRLDPTRLRSRLDTLRTQATSAPSDDLAAAIASVESQLASAERLKQLSASTADRLRLTQARLDELVSRAAEVSIGASDTDRASPTTSTTSCIELEGLRLAVQETPQ